GRVQQLQQDRPLVVEIPVERPDRDPGPPGDRRGRRVVVAARLETGDGRVEDLLARPAAAGLLGGAQHPAARRFGSARHTGSLAGPRAAEKMNSTSDSY